MKTEEMNVFLKKVESIWKKHPEVRFGELLASAANYGAIYYADEATLLKALEDKWGKADEIEEATHYIPNTRGRVYIHKSANVKAIKEEELSEYISKGWLKGRK